MLDYKRKVKIPPKCYEKNQGNNVYMYYNVESVYSSEIKNTRNKRVYVGKKILEDPEYMYPSENYFSYFSDDEDVEQIESDYGHALNIGAHMVIDSVLEELRLKKIFSSVFMGKGDLIASLIGYYISEDTTVHQHFSHYAFNHITYMRSVPSNGTVSNLFNQYITSEMIRDFINDWVVNMKKLMPLEKALVTLDSTNFNTYSESVDLAEFGRAKKKENLPQINLCYALEQASGIPVFYDIYPGSINDQSHLKLAIKQAKDHDLKELTFIMDRGYLNLKNLEYVQEQGYDYIFMSSSHYEELQNIFKKYSEKIRDGAKYYMPFYDLFGVRVEGKIFKTSDAIGNIYLFYSSKKKAVEVLSYHRRVTKFLTDLKNVKKFNSGIHNTYKNYLDFEVDEQDNILNVKVNEKKHQEALDNAGFYFMVSSHKYEREEIVDIYKRQDLVEKMFRMIKSELDASKLYANTNEALEGKVLLVFIASIVRACIANKVKDYLDANSGETVNTVINTLNRIQVIKRTDVYQKVYALTRHQKDILKCFNLDEKDVDELVKKINRMIL